MTVLELVGVAALWMVILLRVPLIVYHRDQLLHWSAAALIAATFTLYIEQVNEILSQILTPYVVYLGIHLATLANSAAVLHFVLSITKRQSCIRLLYAATVTTAIVIVGIYLSADPADPRPGRTFDLPLAYWLLISGFRIVTLICCTALCWFGSLRADHRTMRSGLIIFGLGLLITAIPPAMNFGWLYTKDTVWKAYFPAIDGVAALCVAVGFSLPLILGATRRAADRRAYRLLRPLWLALVDSVPDVRFNYFGNDADEMALPTKLRLYRLSTEIRDAMLLLRDYVDPDTLERARNHVIRNAVPGALAEATITACCLAAAQWYKAEGKRPRESVTRLPDQGRDHLKSEVAFLSKVADAYFSEVVRNYLRDVSGSKKVSVTVFRAESVQEPSAGSG